MGKFKWGEYLQNARHCTAILVHKYLGQPQNTSLPTTDEVQRSISPDICPVRGDAPLPEEERGGNKKAVGD